MKHIWIVFLSISSLIAQTDPKPYVPNLSSVDKNLYFEGVIIPILYDPHKIAILLFDLKLSAKDYEKYKAQVPVVYDAIQMDLTRLFSVFWNLEKPIEKVQLNKRLTSLMKHRFPWVDRVEVSHIRYEVRPMNSPV